MPLWFLSVTSSRFTYWVHMTRCSMLLIFHQVSIHHMPQYSFHTNNQLDTSECWLFCRFAIRCGCRDEAACLTPVGSNLLPGPRRWKIPKYGSQAVPVVFDLSPEVLGSAEGFVQAGCKVQAAFGFDPITDMNWKVCKPVLFISVSFEAINPEYRHGIALHQSIMGP